MIIYISGCQASNAWHHLCLHAWHHQGCRCLHDHPDSGCQCLFLIWDIQGYGMSWAAFPPHKCSHVFPQLGDGKHSGLEFLLLFLAVMGLTVLLPAWHKPGCNSFCRFVHRNVMNIFRIWSHLLRMLRQHLLAQIKLSSHERVEWLLHSASISL